jgi:hypothetical protein
VVRTSLSWALYWEIEIEIKKKKTIIILFYFIFLKKRKERRKKDIARVRQATAVE